MRFKEAPLEHKATHRDDNAFPGLLYGSNGYPTDLNVVVMSTYTCLGPFILGPKCYPECNILLAKGETSLEILS